MVQVRSQDIPTAAASIRVSISAPRLSISNASPTPHGALGRRKHALAARCLKDDLSRYRAGHGAKNMAVVRRFALNLVRANKTRSPTYCSVVCVRSRCFTPNSPKQRAAPFACSCSRSAHSCESAFGASSSPCPPGVRSPPSGAGLPLVSMPTRARVQRDHRAAKQ